MALALESDWGDESLDLGGLVSLGFPLLEGEWPPNYVLSNVIFLCVCVCVCVRGGRGDKR